MFYTHTGIHVHDTAHEKGEANIELEILLSRVRCRIAAQLTSWAFIVKLKFKGMGIIKFYSKSGSRKSKKFVVWKRRRKIFLPPQGHYCLFSRSGPG